jgi:hypothetical protein
MCMGRQGTMMHVAALALLAAAEAAAPQAPLATITLGHQHQSSFVPGARWLDVHGDPIRAHAGHLLLVGGMYHWYGMEYIGAGSPPGVPHTVNVYVSPDLYNWIPAGVALSSTLYVSRPKVIHNLQTGQFVMWCKATPGAAAFVSKTPLGPFMPVFRGDLAGRQVGGLTVYQDPQEPSAAWLAYSAKPSDEPSLPRAMMVLALSANWTWPAAQETATYVGHLEGPAVFFSGQYYLWTSHTSGWDGSPAVVHCAPAMNSSTWSLCGPGNPTHNKSAFQSQSTDVVAVPGDTTNRRFIYLADRWVPYINTTESGRYVWLPLHVVEGGSLSVEWHSSWSY